MSEGKSSPDHVETGKSEKLPGAEGEQPLEIAKKLKRANEFIRRSVGPMIPDEEIEDARKMAEDATNNMKANAFPIKYLEITDAFENLQTNLSLDPWTKPKHGQEDKDLEKRNTPKVNNPAELEVDEIPDFVRQNVEKYFPQYTRMYRGEYDSYIPEFDSNLFDRGRLLYFYAGEKRSHDIPIITLKYSRYKKGYSVSYWNAHQLPDNELKGPTNMTVYGPGETQFQLDQLDLVLDKAKRIMNGEKLKAQGPSEGISDEEFNYFGPDDPRI